MPDDQRTTIEFLASPRAYGLTSGPVESVERVDTHISAVFLAGDRAYKLKRAVQFDYVDFSTVDRRRLSCEAEVRLNRRTAPSLYLGTLPVTRDPHGNLALGGDGEAVDWLVAMVRFDQRTLFDRLAGDRRLSEAMMSVLADEIATLHAGAEVRRNNGGRDGIAWVIEGNALDAADAGEAGLDAGACARVSAAARAKLAQQAEHLEARRLDGCVRWCHGDLHLGNICLVDGIPTLFDAIEFNERIACIDVGYDLAFVLMDLWRHGLARHANIVMNIYLDRTDDIGALRAMPLFLACRAAVKVKTGVAAARVQADSAKAAALRQSATQYLALAESFLAPPGPVVVAIGGFSGSGKSTLARRIADSVGPSPGARLIRSDVIRKRMYGVDPLTPLGSEAYDPEVSARVYRRIGEEARRVLDTGHGVVVDAAFLMPEERDHIVAAAQAAGVRFAGIWLETRAQVLADRVRGRRSDPSDATVAVVERQMQGGAGEIEWPRLDAGRSEDEVLTAARAILR